MYIDTHVGNLPAASTEPPPAPAGAEGVIHPRSLICDRCGNGMNWTRFANEGKRCRKYYCPKCGLTQIFVRRRVDPAPGE